MSTTFWHTRLLAAVIALATFAVLACGPSEQATPTAGPAATPTPTVVQVFATPTTIPAAGLGGTASPSDFLPAPDRTQFAATQIFRIRFSSDVSGAEVDPALIRSPNAQFLLRHITSNLLRVKYNSTELVPDAALSWELKDSGLTLEFKLRQGTQWSQGFGELTADDVVNHYKRMAAQIEGYTSLWKANFVNVKSMEAVDKYTVRFTFTKPDASFIRNNTIHRPGGLTKLEALKQLGAKYNTAPPGIGPFNFKSWEKGVKIELERNPNYFIKGLPYLDKVEMNFIVDDTVSELAIKSGQLDHIQPTNPEVLNRFLKDPGNLKIAAVKGIGSWIINVNTKRPPLDILKVRQAMSYAVDWDTWVKSGADNRGTKNFSPLPSGTLYYDPKCVKNYDYNPTLAKQLLAEAGFPNGTGMRPLVFIAENSGQVPQYTEFLTQHWKAIGIPMDLRVIERTLTTELRNKGEYDLLYIGISVQVLEPSQLALRYFHSANFPPGNNNSYVTGADEAIERLVSNSDPALRKQALCDVLKIVSEFDAPINGFETWTYPIMNPKVENILSWDENTGGQSPSLLEAWIRK